MEIKKGEGIGHYPMVEDSTIKNSKTLRQRDNGDVTYKSTRKVDIILFSE